MSLTLPLVVLACVSATESGPALIDMRGNWNYHAVQVAPNAATLDGTFTIDRQRGNEFTGSWSVIETSAGSPRQLTGVVTGQALDTANVDFDVQTPTEIRRHVARISTDSADGVWVVAGGPSGSFGARRVP